MILITGGMGFIGLHTVKAFLDVGESVVATWNRSYRLPDHLKDEVDKRLFIERVDVSNPYRLIDVAVSRNVTGIVHLAMPGVNQLGPSEDMHVNLLGLMNVLEAARIAKVRRLTMASTSTLYTGLKEGPFREDTLLPLDSRSATEAYKKATEAVMFHFADRTKLDVVAFRTRAVWGPLYYSMVNLPSRICHAAARGTDVDYKGMPGVSGAAGMPYEEDENDFCYVKDLASAIQQLYSKEKLTHRIYNVGAGRPVKAAEFKAAAERAVPGARIAMQPGANPAGGPKDNYLDLTRIREEIAFQPTPIDQAVAEYVDWLREHPQ